MHDLIVTIALIGLLGIGAQWLAWRTQIPAIVLLLLAGLLAGPATGLVDPSQDFGDLLKPMVALAVAIILFEGGMTLNFAEIRGTAKAVRRAEPFHETLEGDLRRLRAAMRCQRGEQVALHRPLGVGKRSNPRGQGLIRIQTLDRLDPVATESEPHREALMLIALVGVAEMNRTGQSDHLDQLFGQIRLGAFSEGHEGFECPGLMTGHPEKLTEIAQALDARAQRRRQATGHVLQIQSRNSFTHERLSRFSIRTLANKLLPSKR